MFSSGMTANLYQLYRTVKMQVSDARAEARAGRKDSARDFLRFVNSSRIVPILAQHPFPAGLSVDVSLLKWEISQLEQNAIQHRPATKLATSKQSACPST
jgi:hypothetical protein